MRVHSPLKIIINPIDDNLGWHDLLRGSHLRLAERLGDERRRANEISGFALGARRTYSRDFATSLRSLDHETREIEMACTYEKRFGWLNVDETPSKVDGSVFRTSDGRAWMTRAGVPVLIPDDYLTGDHYGFMAAEVAVLPDEVDVATCLPLREPPRDDRARAREDIMDVCAVLKDDEEAVADVVNIASGDVVDELLDRLVDALVARRAE